MTGFPERSAAAERFDPPLRRLDWRLSRRQTWSELLADARARLADGERAESAFWHGGLQIGGRPILPETAPEEVPAGSWIRLYAFFREPEPVALPERWLLHEDGELVAVAKPAWLTMQGCRASQRLSLEAALRARLGMPQLVAVHRLDRQTSGVALFAKGPEAARALGRAFASRRVAKRYLALVAPPPAPESFEVHGSLARVSHSRRPRFALGPEGAPGRASHSRFRVLQRLAAGRALLLAEPSTGRTHQLRVHLAARGAPVVGDDLYGPPFAPGAPSAAGRTQLHAWQLELPAGAGPPRCFEAPPPGDFEAVPALVPCPIRPPGPGRGVEPSWT